MYTHFKKCYLCITRMYIYFMAPKIYINFKRCYLQHRDARRYKDSFFLQGTEPKKIQVILKETLACFVPCRAKELSAPCTPRRIKEMFGICEIS